MSLEVIENINRFLYKDEISKSRALIYIFTGNSYHALKKLDKIILSIQENPRLLQKINAPLTPKQILPTLQNEGSLAKIIEEFI